MSGVPFMKELGCKRKKRNKVMTREGTELRHVLCVYPQGWHEGQVENTRMCDDGPKQKRVN